MRVAIGVAAVILGCAGALQAQSDHASPQELIKEAVAFQQQGKMDAAIRNYELFLDMYPKVPEVRSNLAAALVATGHYQDAIDQYQRALEVRPDPKVRVNLALAYYKAADFQRAVDQLQQVRGADQNDKQSALLLSDCYLRLGKNKDAIDLLKPVYLADTNDLGVAYLLGTALARDGQTDAAQSVINQITTHGDSAEVRLLVATAKFTGRDYKGALSDLREAIKANPNLPDVYAYYGLALLATGDQAEAQAAFAHELEHDPNNFDANLRMGFLLRGDQQYDKALPYLEHAQMVRPGDMATRYQIALVRLAQGKEDWARTELESITKEAPSFVEAHVSLATLYFREKRKTDGERERATVEKLNAQRQAQQVQ